MSEKPKRIQRKRTKGWRMPENAVYVGRPTIWGNPFPTAEEFRGWLVDWKPGTGLTERERILQMIGELRGKDLACWCSLDCACHADILLELANKEAQ